MNTAHYYLNGDSEFDENNPTSPAGIVQLKAVKDFKYIPTKLFDAFVRIGYILEMTPGDLLLLRQYKTVGYRVNFTASFSEVSPFMSQVLSSIFRKALVNDIDLTDFELSTLYMRGYLESPVPTN